MFFSLCITLESNWYSAQITLVTMTLIKLMLIKRIDADRTIQQIRFDQPDLCHRRAKYA